MTFKTLLHLFLSQCTQSNLRKVIYLSIVALYLNKLREITYLFIVFIYLNKPKGSNLSIHCFLSSASSETISGHGLDFNFIYIGVIIILTLVILALVTVIVVYRRGNNVKINQGKWACNSVCLMMIELFLYRRRAYTQIRVFY